jgi:hypothetical protein
MTQRLELTADWPLEQIMPYSPQITAAFRKLRDKFPDDSTMESMASDIMTGAVQLWLMLDGDDFKGVVLTSIKTIEATGYKAVVVAGLAGEDGVELSPHIAAIEDWGREQGCKACCPVGRKGWEKPLAKLGYEVERVTYRKDLQ